MKNLLKTLTIILLTGVLMSSALQAQKQKRELKGVWHLVSGKINGKPVLQVLNNRTWEFKKDNTFEGRKLFPDNTSRKYNEGIYMLPNDTTMVCLHKNSSGNMDRFALTYNYTIRNDSLHFYGYYFISAKENRRLLQPVYIDEWWVRKRK